MCICMYIAPMTTELHCEHCDKYMATLRDAKVRAGMAVYCKPCNDIIKSMLNQNRNRNKSHSSGMPDFLKDIFGGR